MRLFYQLNYVRCLHLMYLKMASAERIELSHGLLESLSPNPWNISGYTKNGSRIGIWTLFSILRGWYPNTHRRCDRWNGSLCRCCPGYSWMKAKWLSWLSNRPLKWCFSEDSNPKLNVRSVAWYIHFHHRSINWLPHLDFNQGWCLREHIRPKPRR